MASAKNLSAQQKEEILSVLEARFNKNRHRHKGLTWSDVVGKLKDKDAKLWSIQQMEETGGEPDVVVLDENSGEMVFCDCSAESPKIRRSVCFDPAALESRKQHKPKHSAVGMAAEMGIDLLTETQYRQLQELDEFDTKTSSWVQTPAEIRKLGGALFCDRRFNHIFLYHNGAESYYASRGFRGILTI